VRRVPRHFVAIEPRDFTFLHAHVVLAKNTQSRPLAALAALGLTRNVTLEGARAAKPFFFTF
jgi:hypothetical protein